MLLGLPCWDPFDFDQGAWVVVESVVFACMVLRSTQLCLASTLVDQSRHAPARCMAVVACDGIIVAFLVNIILMLLG